MAAGSSGGGSDAPTGVHMRAPLLGLFCVLALLLVGPPAQAQPPPGTHEEPAIGLIADPDSWCSLWLGE